MEKRQVGAAALRGVVLRRLLLWLLLLVAVAAVFAHAASHDSPLSRPPPESATLPASGPERAPRTASCEVCATAERAGIRLSPFQRVYRCRHPGEPRILWPRDRVRREDLRQVVIDVDPIWIDDLTDGCAVPFTWRSHHGVEYVEFLRWNRLPWNQSGSASHPGPLLVLPVQHPRLERAIARMAHGSLWINLGPSKQLVSRFRLDPPTLLERQLLARCRDQSTHPAKWIRQLLVAQVLLDQGFAAGAWREAARFLEVRPGEPHAVAIQYAALVRAKLSTTSYAQCFGTSVMEVAHRERLRSGIECHLEPGAVPVPTVPTVPTR